MLVTREQILDVNNLTGHLVLEGLVEADDSLTDAVYKDGHADVTVLVNGVEINLERFVKHWESCVDKMIQHEARKIVKERANDTLDKLDELVKQAVKAVSPDLDQEDDG